MNKLMLILLLVTTTHHNTIRSIHYTKTATSDILNDALKTKQGEETYPLLNSQNVSLIESGVRITNILITFLDNEYYGNCKWAHQFIFPGSTDDQHYEDMDMTKYVGNTKCKERNIASNLRIYFGPNKYPVEEELKLKSEISSDIYLKRGKSV